MNASLKSFAALVVTIGISSLGAANTALAGGHGSSHGSSGHVSGSHPGNSSSHIQGNRGGHQFDKHDPHKYDHDRDRYRGWGHYGYGCWPSNYCSSYCCPSYPSCYTPGYCCECAPQSCPVYCPPSPPVCEQAPCFPSYSEYCADSCFPGCYGGSCYRPWSDKCFDRYHDRDFRKDHDGFKGHLDSSKPSHVNFGGKSQFTGGLKGNAGIGQMGKLASRTGGMSGGAHGGRK